MTTLNSTRAAAIHKLMRTETSDNLRSLLTYYSNEYYNSDSGECSVSDQRYDELLDCYTSKYGPYISVGSHPVTGIQRILPQYMGSQNKIKTESEISRWIARCTGECIITDKVDGVSCLYHNNTLYTRGDGTTGTDISHILAYLNLPEIPHNSWVRMEIVLLNSVFKERYTGANARNCVSGIINSKYNSSRIIDETASARFRDLSLIAYEYNCGDSMPQSLQLQFLNTHKFTTPWTRKVHSDVLTQEYLSELLAARKTSADYDIDGLVLCNNSPYELAVGENPRYSVAFKMTGECVNSVVVGVEWNVSKHGIYKPRINISEVYLCGVTINWTSGFNARFIIDNNIGPGAVVTITRSGDVIPYITNVVSGTAPSMPLTPYQWASKKNMMLTDSVKKTAPSTVVQIVDSISYDVWYTKSDVDISIVTSNNTEVEIRGIIEFFKTVNAKFVGESSITKIYNAGYTTLGMIFKMSVSDYLLVPGFKLASATRLKVAVHDSVTNVDIATLAAATGIMGQGIGEKKIRSVFNVYPDIISREISFSALTELIRSCGGFDKMALQFATNLPRLRDWIAAHPLVTIAEPATEIIFDSGDSNILSLLGVSVVFSGFRSAQLELEIIRRGGKITAGVSRKTGALVTTDRNSTNSKRITADNLKIPIYTEEEFRVRYIK